ncbi:VF530 family DNA-binding protein [Allorhodopirellula heiligendammensis]|uniref:DUF2132 domain-containing protein n=1 Tax=Allorhodopirellula heiligendammensis TaxID=2714739 RepID=A0A5C6C661_9BACT|nr:VF530 family protein [Allorhodopirellula heiligendammensis]TWU18854.1 hypothetical protein Poly21_10210 [Allorhodopirellula heiligendammensis]
MNQPQPNNPLHGVTLKAMLEYLVADYGWERLEQRINMHCFNYEPSINSSLKFLRKTEWARVKVERLYLNSISYAERKEKNAASDVSSNASLVDALEADKLCVPTRLKKNSSEAVLQDADLRIQYGWKWPSR